MRFVSFPHRLLEVPSIVSDEGRNVTIEGRELFQQCVSHNKWEQAKKSGVPLQYMRIRMQVDAYVSYLLYESQKLISSGVRFVQS